MRMHDFEMLPELAFQRGEKGRLTRLWGKGGGSAPAPDPNIGLAQKQLADLSKEEWDMFKTDIYPKLLEAQDKQEKRSQGMYDITTATMNQQLEYAKKDRERYEEGGIPAMQKIKADADLYNSDDEQERLAGQAKSDVATASQNAARDLEMRNRSYGIDPTSGTAIGLSNANSINQSLMEAQAVNQTRKAAKDIGLAKQANVYNMYAGLPAQADTAVKTGVSAGSTGLAAGQTQFNNAAAAGDTLGKGVAPAMSGWNSVGQIGVGKYNADVSAYRAEKEAEGAFYQGIGSMVGAVGGAAIGKWG